MEVPPSDDDNSGVIVGIIIILLISVFLIIVLIALGLSDQTTNTPTPVPVQSGTFLSACTTTACNDPLICDGNTFVCKLPAGTPCSDGSDCVTGLICSGICATGATGGLNQLCPCSPGYLCTPQTTPLTICKGAGGTPCRTGADCASDLCQSNGFCAAGAPNAFPCTIHSECASNNCSDGFCQNIGVVSGSLGAACAGLCVGFTGATCISTAKNPITCECLGGIGEPGTCVTATQGILSTCSIFSFCAEDLICFNNTGTNCTGGNTGCICAFPYDDPNTLATGSNCIDGMSPIAGRCFNNNGLGCDRGGLCANAACGGNSVLAIYQFSTSGTGNIGTNYVGATNTSILVASTGPTGIIQPHKMIAITSGNTDVIYLVDKIAGLFVMVYDPITMNVLAPWELLIPHNSITTIGNITSNKTLIDVGINEEFFIVAFDEIVTGGITGRNDTVYIGPNTATLTPFNFQPGSGITGTQYDINNNPLSIDYIDISPPNDISPGNDVLISSDGTIYVKPSTQSRYSVGVIQGGPLNQGQMIGTTGPARFYYDILVNTGVSGMTVCPENSTDISTSNPIECPSYYNISFIAPFRTFGTGTYNQVLQFSGNIASISMPIDRFDDIQYEVFDYDIFSPPMIGMSQGNTIMLSNAYNGDQFIDTIVAISFGGNTTLIPYRVSDTSRVAATGHAYYVLSIGSCT